MPTYFTPPKIGATIVMQKEARQRRTSARRGSQRADFPATQPTGTAVGRSSSFSFARHGDWNNRTKSDANLRRISSFSEKKVEKEGQGKGEGQGLLLKWKETQREEEEGSVGRIGRPLALPAALERMVVTVSVEGSPGPLRIVVEKDETVTSLINQTLRRYIREGRRCLPPFDLRDTSAFQLHLSNFSFQGLDKALKVGEIGSRSFYLRREREGESESDGALLPAPTRCRNALFLSILVRKLRKIHNRSVSVWSFLDRLLCG